MNLYEFIVQSFIAERKVKRADLSLIKEDLFDYLILIFLR